MESPVQTAFYQVSQTGTLNIKLSVRSLLMKFSKSYKKTNATGYTTKIGPSVYQGFENRYC